MSRERVDPDLRSRIEKVIDHIEPWASGPVAAKHVGMILRVIRGEAP